MPMPKADEAAKIYFRTLVPEDSRVTVKPMFGHLAAFVNGNMFTGMFGEQLFVRLDAAGREELLAIPGAGPFEPMAGRPMAEYVVLPDAWRPEPERTRQWMERSLEWAATLPAKAPKPAKPPKTRKGSAS